MTWKTSGRLRWHYGVTRGASDFAGALDDGTWVMVHRLSGRPAPTVNTAVHILKDATAKPSNRVDGS
ncbi:hypothetical protein [Streptomyces sp. NPDC056323]|uniref:hypothetical protein n=1 Tax=Streptomyces sp. NPDC056323 TaxID=3345784 RepID=UPI0035DFFE12